MMCFSYISEKNQKNEKKKKKVIEMAVGENLVINFYSDFVETNI